MPQILLSLSTWLHALATVIFIGHYLLLTLIYLPVLAKAPSGGTLLSAISKRSRSWMYVSLIVFAVTGIYLTFADSNYLGLGNFGNVWGVLMLVKHILILAMIVMGGYFNAILHVGPLMSSNSGAEQAIARFSSYSKWMAGSGALVLLLTALAQFE